MTRGALAEMRKLLLELRPTALRDSQMGELLHHLGNALVGRYESAIEYDIQHGDHRLPEPVQLAFYRIAQEALNNVVKHAQAETITISYVGEPEQPAATLTIADDGIGFDQSAVPTNHYGLRIMSERATEIGAAFTIESEPGEGTLVRVAWAS
jgi:signal transduction histidine kinase